MAFDTPIMSGRGHSRRGVRTHGEIGRRMARFAVFAWMAISVTAVFAADSPPLPPGTDTEPPLAEVIVTGSRIAQSNLNSTSPIQVVTSKEIQLQGTTN